jgi:glycosyltransferase involved in cell wall biosynthesis
MSLNEDEKLPLARGSVGEQSKFKSQVRPLVTILINNYNYGSFLNEAIESALAQTYDNIEVVVVDDGSTDSSREVIAKYGNRIIPVMKDNGGQASAFNAGFAASKGDILCLLDADDLFLAEKVSCIVQIFDDNPKAGWCFDRVQEFDNKTGGRYPPIAKWRCGPWDERANIVAVGLPPNIPTATSGLSFRRSALAVMLPMPEIIRITSDGYLKLAALGLDEGWMASQELSLQRIHGENAYTRKRSGNKSIMALTGVFIGVGLYERIPILRRLAITMFSRGLGMCWISGVSDPDYRRLAGSFLRRMALRTKIQILLKALYCSATVLLSNSRVERVLAARS